MEFPCSFSVPGQDVVVPLVQSRALPPEDAQGGFWCPAALALSAAPILGSLLQSNPPWEGSGWCSPLQALPEPFSLISGDETESSLLVLTVKQPP